MRYAICNETFLDWPFERAFDCARECGYTGLEIAPFTIDSDARRISPSRRTEVRKQAEAAGLEVIGLHWLLAKTQGFHLTSPEAAIRGATAEYLRELARLCRDLGGSILVFGSPQQRNLLPGVSRDEGMKCAAEVFSSVIPDLDALGVTLAVEPLAPAEGNFLNTAAEGRRLVEMVAHRRCRLHLDCKAMSSEPQPIVDILKRHRDILVHFHANDPNQQGPGFGRLDFVPILGALREIGYAGWVSVEVFDYAPGAERLARDSIDYLRRCEERLPSRS
ncbi:MAG: sugar phosphate isomerase/epimerase [Planctomycetia bacterium]|nr:sugar phosphate isomerase/epimerase [Planctomycetia bacterium]